MKIDRVKLIELIEAEIARIERAADADYEREVLRYEEARRSYVSTTRDAWNELALRINAACSRNEVITAEDIPPELRHYRGTSIELWSGKTPTKRVPQVSHLRSLVDVLRATDDSTVSTYALEKMGFALGRTLRGGGYVGE